jgi:DnaJ-class molecular chaperone
MPTPYEILKVDLNADDQTIRKAYVEETKKYPPDRDPQKFKEIMKAYESIQDQKKRLLYDLYDEEIPASSLLEILRTHYLQQEKRCPPSLDQFKELFKND